MSDTRRDVIRRPTCVECGKPHARRDLHGGKVTWADPDDGHVYLPAWRTPNNDEADAIEAALVAHEESDAVVERCNRLLGKPPIEMYGWDSRDAAVLAVLRAARGVPTEEA